MRKLGLQNVVVHLKPNFALDPDIQTLMSNGQFYEAVLPLPTCRSNSGCRSVVEPRDPKNGNKFNLNEAFHIISSVSPS